MARRRGMTLIELLIAFAIFTMMLAGMVALTVGTLQGWRSSERDKDTYERAQRVLRQIQEDLLCAFVDDAWIEDPVMGRLRYAQMMCESDDSGRQQLTLVRAVQADGPPQPRAAGQRYNAVDAYQALSEVHYRLDAESGTLWRIEQPFERLDTRRDRSLFNPRNREPGSRAFTDLGVPVDNGILHLEIRFWSQLTRQWETAKTDRDGGPALEWDSSRRELNDFFLGMRVRNPADPPQFVMPRLARVILVFEPVTGEARGVPLAADLGPTDREMKVEDSRPIPDPPGYLRVGGEWIEYDRKEAHAIGIKRRGLDAVRRRGEKPVHPAGTTVHYGETFVADVVIPTARDARP